MLRKGLFISFEGADGCGKSTQLSRTRQWLTSLGYEVNVTREPGGCPISERIRALLLDVGSAGMSPECEALLFAAARAEHVRRVIRPAVEAGHILLCDRFLDSSIAYQGYGRGLGEDYIRQINERAMDGCIPDRTLLFAADPAVMAGRLQSGRSEKDRMEREGEAFVRSLGEGFLRSAAKEPNRVAVIDASGDVESVFAAVREILTPLLPASKAVDHE